MFTRILVCLDRSPVAEQVLPYATAQALAFHATLVLLHIIPEPYIATPSIPGTSILPVQNPVDLHNLPDEEKKAASYLSGIADELQEQGVTIETVILQGEASQSIIDYALGNGIDLIAIATHGRGGLGKVFYGSVAEQVLKKSGLPILLIRVKSS